MLASREVTMSSRETEELLQSARELSVQVETRDSEERWSLIRELHLRPEARVFEQCLSWSSSAAPFERSLAADILAQLGCVDSVFPFRADSLPVIRRLLNDSDASVVASALLALGHLGVGECRKDVCRLSAHPDSHVRFGVVFALLGDESPESIETLIVLSRDEDTKVRDWATFGLGSQVDVDTEAIRQALLDRAMDGDADTRAEALAGLVKRGDPRVLEPLRAALESKSVGTLEVEAARDLGAPELSASLERLRPWWDVDTQLLEEAIARCRGIDLDRRGD